ncbi:C-type lectin-like, partial [Python bivittatus]|uniref:C-type lectin-like n=1 Tax=Python bivittatus TaxID=176946 RepID=A0A9F2RFD3_PYTBI
TFCRAQKRRGHLASIHDEAESRQLAKYVSRHLRYRNVWIGLRAEKQGRVWRWTDVSTTNYATWEHGEPNNVLHNEDCAELWSRSGYLYWNDNNCNSLTAFLCQYPLQP